MLTPRKKWSLAGMLIGAAMLPAPLSGIFGTIGGMTASFDAVAASKTPSPSDLADAVYFSMAWTGVGIAVFFVGIGLFVVSLVRLVTAPRQDERR